MRRFVGSSYVFRVVAHLENLENQETSLEKLGKNEGISFTPLDE